MSDKGLLPCPFCGRRPYWIKAETRVDNEDRTAYAVSCPGVDSECLAPRTRFFVSGRMAADEWNKRA